MSLFSSGNSNALNYRLALLVSMGIVALIGYAIRFSQGPAPEWFNDAIGSIAYEIFWILLGAFLVPDHSIRSIAVTVCLLTCILECLQLWQPPFLQAARATWIGRLVLGTTFSWFDFPPYVIGSWAGWYWARTAQRLGTTKVSDR